MLLSFSFLLSLLVFLTGMHNNIVIIIVIVYHLVSSVYLYRT